MEGHPVFSCINMAGNDIQEQGGPSGPLIILEHDKQTEKTPLLPLHNPVAEVYFRLE